MKNLWISRFGGRMVVGAILVVALTSAVSVSDVVGTWNATGTEKLHVKGRSKSVAYADSFTFNADGTCSTADGIPGHWVLKGSGVTATMDPVAMIPIINGYIAKAGYGGVVTVTSVRYVKVVARLKEEGVAKGQLKGSFRVDAFGRPMKATIGGKWTATKIPTGENSAISEPASADLTLGASIVEQILDSLDGNQDSGAVAGQ